MTGFFRSSWRCMETRHEYNKSAVPYRPSFLTISRQPRWVSGLRRSRVHSLMIARRSLCSGKLGSNPGQGSKGINFSGWHGLDHISRRPLSALYYMCLLAPQRLVMERDYGCAPPTLSNITTILNISCSRCSAQEHTETLVFCWNKICP